MSDNQSENQNVLYSLLAIAVGITGNIVNFLADAEALFSTVGFLLSTILIGIGVIGFFVQQDRVKLKDGILYAVIWTLFIAFTGAGYYILVSQPITVYGRILDNVNQRKPKTEVEISLYHYHTGTTRQVLTDSSGDFRFGDVNDGEYDILINDVNIYSGNSPGGLDKLFRGDINVGQFYFENVSGGGVNPPSPSSTDTPEPPTTINTDVSTPADTPEPPTATNTPFLFTGGLYDDFSDDSYDGSFNPSLWYIAQDQRTGVDIAVEQYSGWLRLYHGSGSTGGFLVKLNNIYGVNVQSFQLDMMLGSQTQGDGNITLTISSNTTPNTWREFGLYRDNGRTFFQYNGNTPIFIELDTWYVLRFEFDERASTFRYLLNDRLIHDEIVEEFDSFEIQIQLWRRSSSVVVEGFIDNVRIEYDE